jgi:hypothetical protein
VRSEIGAFGITMEETVCSTPPSPSPSLSDQLVVSTDAHWRYCPSAPGNVRGKDVFCQGTLRRSQLAACQSLLSSNFSIGSEHALQWGFPTVEIRPVELVYDIMSKLGKSTAGVSEVRITGSAVNSLLCEKCSASSGAAQDINIRFMLTSQTRTELFTTRDLLLDAFVTLLPVDVARKSRHMLAAAYVQRMQVTGPQRLPSDEAYAMYSLPSSNGSSLLTIYFVQVDRADQDVLQLRLPRDVLKSWHDDVCGVSSSPSKTSPRSSPEPKQVPEFLCDYRTQQPTMKALQSAASAPANNVVTKMAELVGHIAHCGCCYTQQPTPQTAQ